MPNAPLAMPEVPTPQADQVAQILGVGLTQVIVTGFNPIRYSLFLNERPLPQEELDALYVSIDVSRQDTPAGPVQGTLSQKVKTASGDVGKQQIELFPGTVELVAVGRRISISCPNPQRLDDVWIRLGLKLDGSGHEITGVRSLQLVLNNDLLSAQIVWNDGSSEDLLPQ